MAGDELPDVAGDAFLLLLALLLLLLPGRLSLTFQRPVLDLMTGGDLGEQDESSSSSGATGFGFPALGCNLETKSD